MKNKLLLLLLLTLSIGLNAQTDMFPEYTQESYDIAMNYKAEHIQMFNVHKPNNICYTYMYYNIFHCTSYDGFLDVDMKSQGAVREGEIYAKQFSVNNDLTAIGAWYRHVGAQPGDQVEVRWTSPVNMTIRLI